jgi:hypothetical protein
VSILAGGILYLFAEITYSRRIVSGTADLLPKTMTKAEPKLRSVFARITNSKSYILPLTYTRKTLEQPSSAPLGQYQKPNPIWILVPWGER